MQYEFIGQLPREQVLFVFTDKGQADYLKAQKTEDPSSPLLPLR